MSKETQLDQLVFLNFDDFCLCRCHSWPTAGARHHNTILLLFFILSLSISRDIIGYNAIMVLFSRRCLLTMSSTFRLLYPPSDPSPAAEEVLLKGVGRKGVSGMVAGAGRRAKQIS